MASPAPSSTWRSWKSTSLLAKRPDSGWSSAAPTSSPSQPGSCSVSLLRSATYSAPDAPIPALNAAAMPRFSPSGITSTPGKCSSTKPLESSVEPLSTRTVSKSLKDCSCREPRQSLRNRLPFQFGMTTVTRGGTASDWPAWPLLPGLETVDLDVRGQPHQSPDRARSPFLGYLESRRVLCVGHILVLRPRGSQRRVYVVGARFERHLEREIDRRLLARFLPSEPGSFDGRVRREDGESCALAVQGDAEDAVLDDFLGITLGQEFSPVEQHGLRAESLHHPHAVGDEEDRGTRLPEVVHPLDGLLLESRVARREGLVYDEDVGLDVDRHGEAEATTHAAGVGLYRLVHEPPEIGEGFDVVEALEHLLVFDAEDQAAQHRVLTPRKERIEPGSDPEDRRQPAFDLDLSRRRLQNARDYAQ